MSDRTMAHLQKLARMTGAREADDFPAIDADATSTVLEEVILRRVELEQRIKAAPNGRARSPHRKEHWWLGQLAELLEDWLALSRR